MQWQRGRGKLSQDKNQQNCGDFDHMLGKKLVICQRIQVCVAGAGFLAVKEYKFCTSALMLTLLYTNWQRPGTVKNMMIEEYQNTLFVKDSMWSKIKRTQNGTECECKVMYEPRDLPTGKGGYFTYVRPKLVRAGRDIPNFFILTYRRNASYFCPT